MLQFTVQTAVPQMSKRLASPNAQHLLPSSVWHPRPSTNNLNVKAVDTSGNGKSDDTWNTAQ